MSIPSVRDPEYLHPLIVPLWQRTMTRARAAGMIPVLTFAYRSNLQQERLWQIGRRGVEGEKTVTNARGGQSWHNVERPAGNGQTRGASLAFDIALLDAKGKAVLVSSDPAWLKLGEIGKSLGLTWGGDWQMRDYGHFQLDNGGRLSLADAMAGRDPEEVA